MLKALTLSDYLEQLASASPTPGGGAAAAITAAQGVALLSMVCNLTLGKPKFVQVEEEVRSILEILKEMLQAMMLSAQHDTVVFQSVMEAYRLPKGTPIAVAVRDEAVQASLKRSSEVPFALFKQCLAALPLADRLETIGNPSVLSDVVVGRHLLVATIHSAKANVEVNLDGIMDEAFCAQKRRDMGE